jgi:putative OPT family oligopeptide transporter
MAGKTASFIQEEYVPYVSHNDYSEITLRGVILSAILAVVLGAANIYLGLLVGLTVSASIPASVISMACLKWFKDSNILENNLVQTAASAGEALAAGVIFTLPGMVVMNNKRDQGDPVFANVEGWDTFLGVNYLYSTFLAMFGGLLGIAWSIPLRKALIVEMKPPLQFPEGVATAQVLQAGEKGGNAVKAVGAGAGVGAGIALFESMGLWKGKWGFGWFFTDVVGSAFYPCWFEIAAKPALLGVGYIVGLNIAGVLFLGSMINYFAIIPVSAYLNGRWDRDEWLAEQANATNPLAFAPDTVAGREFGETRYIGVGMMIIGGLWSLFAIRHALWKSVKLGYTEFKAAFSKKKGAHANPAQDSAGVTTTNLKSSESTMSSDQTTSIARWDRDIPFNYILLAIALTILPLYILFSSFSDEWAACLLLSIVILPVSFLFSAVAAYMAGLVGSSNNPVSGVTICSSLILSALILALFGADNPLGPPTAVIMCCAVASCCAISGDNMQDLKAGYMLGATPWKQEIMMAVGVISTSLVVAPILELLNQAYTLGEAPLTAPQATIIATIPSGLISGNLPWTYIGVGIGLGALVILIDNVLQKFKFSFRLPVLAFAIAVYLPGSYLTSIFLGALVHIFAKTDPHDQASEGVLYSAGLVAGDALFGIFLAVPVVITSNPDVFMVVSDVQYWPIIFPFIFLVGSMTWVAKFKPFTGKRTQTDSEF